MNLPYRVASLKPLIAPQSVAVIGASSDPNRIGGRPINYMKRHGFAGEILPVNPGRGEVQSLRAFPDVKSLPVTPDTAIVAVPGEAAIQAIRDLGTLGTKSAIVFSSGFAEAGPAGVEMQDRLAETAREFRIRVLGPNCAGLFNARIGFYPIFASIFSECAPSSSRIGMVGQSGAFCTHVYAAARARNIGMDVCVTTGNEMDVDVADALQWMVEDPEIDVIAAYSEGFSDGSRLVGALEAARRAKKPIVMMKVGSSDIGALAVQSHTAAIAGNDRIADAVLGDFGVVRAETVEHLLDVAYTATRKIYPVPNRLGVLSISGGVGILIADAASSAGIAMPGMPSSSQAKLRKIVPFASLRNPVDCTAQAINDPAVIGQFAEVLAQEGYTTILTFLSTGGGKSLAPAIRAGLLKAQRCHRDRLWVMSQIAGPQEATEYEQEGFVCFEDPSRAVRAIKAMEQFGCAFARITPEAGANPLAHLRIPEAGINEAQAKALLSKSGIAIAPERECVTADEAIRAAEELGFPVVLKILSPDIVHKSDIGCVLLNLGDAAAVRAGFEIVLAAARKAAPEARVDGVLVAKQLTNGIECIVGTTFDPTFGPVVMFGLGGVFVEILQDVVFKQCPFSPEAAREMLLRIKGAPLLQGARGTPKSDIDALARLVSNLSVFAFSTGRRIASIDLNPVLVLPEGQGAYAADAVIIPSSSPDSREASEASSST